MKRFLSWICRRPEPEPVQDGVRSAGAVDPLTSSKIFEKIQKDEDLYALPIPGAFPPSPSVSPRLAPRDEHLEEDYVLVDTTQEIGVDVSTAPILHTDLGSYLHPRRPKYTPSPQRFRPAEPATAKPIRRPHFQDDQAIEDPYGRKYKAYEKLPLGRAMSAVSLFYPEQKPLPDNRIASILAPEWEQREKERKALEGLAGRSTRIIPRGPAVRPLSREWIMKVSEAMRTLQGYAVARSPSGDDLYQKDIATCIKPLAWLNDEIINAYLTVLVQYLRQSTGNTASGERPKFHAFNTFFYSTLRDKGYQGVRRWANRAKIGGEALLDVDTVFIPVHQASHWTLMVVRPVDRTIEYFDSLGARGMREVEVIKKWLAGELGNKFDAEEWSFLPSVSSHQDNMSDCGVFLLINAKAIALGIEPTAFGAKDTVDLRVKIVAELMNGGLHGPFYPVDKMGQTWL
ncbi:uncharacterized protein N7473_004973 [Penicillium subrubescens]|uniref:Ubiquitin-like-specific protease 1 n=1 Tax=Penicillium subrubescens TaxID=1316194 RepID=A0A1Q5UI27_9EURO|nr:uncharacterized protein N7473_004973 [Penicillium subrubescens]KAJ5900903.1 hypothetical protein N7473_004973 [Penicillium subrubescens]OKP12089.1 Ubiquitin-like-specific protease 1 [Penicillium subrubescens]